MQKAVRKDVARLDEMCRRLIAASPMVFVASYSAEGNCDVTPRGGPPGFVTVLDEHRLAIPDATGNNRLDTLRNVVATGHAGLIFLIPGRDQTLRVNGAACVSDAPALLDEVAGALRALGAGREHSDPAAFALVQAESLADGLRFAEAFAPEHLELAGESAERLAPRVRAAGCVFVGRAGATAFGDYVAGSNHCLPTGGSARFASGLSPRAFRRRMSVVHIGEAAAALAAAGAPIARAEGFTVHAESMEARVEENGRDD
jgi:hypothetical protein